MNIFMPSMPGMMKVFGVSYDTVQFTLTLYLVALAVAQLFIGPLSDRFGRRPIALWGLLVFLIGSFICITAPDILILSVGRAIQAAGGCAGIVMARTMIRDLYGSAKAAKMIAVLVLAMIIIPVIAPSLGGFLDEIYGWQAGFYVVFGFALLVLFASYYFLQETHFNLHDSISVIRTIHGFGQLLGHLSFNKFALQISFASAAFFAFIGGSPYVVMELMGHSPKEYGFYFMVVGLSYMIGNFVTTRTTETWGINVLINLGIYLAAAGGLFLLICYFMGILNAPILFAAMSAIALANGLSLPTSIAGAIGVDPERIGAAAGLSGFLQIAAGAAASFIVGNMLSHSAAPLVYIMSGSAFLALASYKVAEVLEAKKIGEQLN